jgi:hypothetical protein
LHIEGCSGSHGARGWSPNSSAVLLGLGGRFPADGCPLPPKADFDGDVDQADFGHLQTCRSGANVQQNIAGCQDARLDDDADVDAEDIAIFISGMGS